MFLRCDISEVAIYSHNIIIVSVTSILAPFCNVFEWDIEQIQNRTKVLNMKTYLSFALHRLPWCHNQHPSSLVVEN